MTSGGYVIMAKKSVDDGKPIVIKKYANRRLYNTSTSSYVTLDHLAQMVKESTEFTVHDAKSGEDITRQVLTHIIVEEEGKGGQNLLPISFLRHLISFYGDSLQAVVPGYLENSMQSFAKNQEQMRDYMNGTIGSLSPFGSLGDVGKQNVAMMENAMKMFAPFYPVGSEPRPESDPGNDKPAAQESAAPETESDPHLDALKNQLDEMQKRLDELSSKK